MNNPKVKSDNTEADDILAKYGSTKQESNMPQIPFLIVNTASEDSEGKEIPVKTFHLVGTDLYSKSVRIRPLVYLNKLNKQVKDAKGWKTVAETIMYNMNETPVDTQGGVACGRKLGRAMPSDWNDEQKKLNKSQANFYGILFGMVEFPGKEPQLVNWRIPSGKAKQVSDVLNALKNEFKTYTNVFLDLKLSVNPNDKTSPHPVLKVEPDVKKQYPVSEVKDAIVLIDEYVKAHNSRVRASHDRARAYASGTDIAKAAVDSVLEDDLNDEIPFN